MLGRLVDCGIINEAERKGMQSGNGGQLNPGFAEWLMGFPRGWTDLDCEVNIEGWQVSWNAEWEGVPRTLKGVTRRKDKIKCLGNAIVPEIARMIFEEIGCLT